MCDTTLDVNDMIIAVFPNKVPVSRLNVTDNQSGTTIRQISRANQWLTLAGRRSERDPNLLGPKYGKINHVLSLTIKKFILCTTIITVSCWQFEPMVINARTNQIVDHNSHQLSKEFIIQLCNQES